MEAAGGDGYRAYGNERERQDYEKDLGACDVKGGEMGGAGGNTYGADATTGRGFKLQLNNFALAIVLCQLCVINRGLDLT